jgi:hypothetical protein
MTEESHVPVPSFSGPLFVVGMWRSGTSLLYTLLNQHPQIALTYETDLLFLRPLFSRKGSSRDWLARWEFWSSALSRHHIPIDRMPASVPDLATGALAIWKAYAGSAVMGEKSPNCFDCLQTLAREFPGARFIVIWRDIADICRSMVLASAGSSFFSKPGILYRAVVGSHKLKLECEALRRQEIPLHEIQYEEMIEDTAKVMAGICNFLELPFDPRMATLQGSDRSSIYPGPHHDQVKSETILGSRARPEVLSSRWKRKVQRYTSYWQAQYGGTWPRYPKFREGASDYPSWAERFCDEMLYRGLRRVDRFTVWVYCNAPFWFLQSYRAVRNRCYGRKQGPLT